MNPVVTRVEEIPNLTLGEGPHWDVKTQSLFFVDVFEKSLHKFVPSTRKHTEVVLGKHISMVIPVKSRKDTFIITSSERELALLTWDGVSKELSQLEKITDIDGDSKNTLNDGKCDSSGKLWIGTMGPEPFNTSKQIGSLFSYSQGKVIRHVSDVGISNGLAFDTKLKRIYFIDSLNHRVDGFDYDSTIEPPSLSNRTTVFDFKESDIDGFPDGMTIDIDGNLWIAVFNGSRVIKINPKTTNCLLQIVEIPAKQVTSLAWGGANLDILHVTTANITLNDEKLPPSPNNGAIFSVSGLGTKGSPGESFVL